MRHCTELVVTLSQLLAQVVATPHEQISVLPRGWKRVGNPSDDQGLSLQINLAHQNLSHLSSILRQVSDPDSPCYGKYLDRDEVYDLFKPAEQARAETEASLLDSGLSRRYHRPRWWLRNLYNNSSCELLAQHNLLNVYEERVSEGSNDTLLHPGIYERKFTSRLTDSSL